MYETINYKGKLYEVVPAQKSFFLKPKEKPLATTIEQVNEALQPEWFGSLLHNKAELEPKVKDGNVTTEADANRVIAFRDLLNIVAYCNANFEKGEDLAVVTRSQFVISVSDGYESPIRFNSEEAAEYAIKHFWPIFHKYFTGEDI